MHRPRLLDLCCCAGGAARGYQQAGWHVTGVDIAPQPNYVGDVFVQADALDYLAAHGHEFAAVHASPPCQSFTAYRRKGHGVGDGYVNLIPDTRALLSNFDVPWVIENVEAARPELRNPLTLCGSSFGLDVRRHRLFEVSGFETLTPPCDHGWQRPRFAQATNRTNQRSTVEVGVWRIPLGVQHNAMGIDWMTLEELSEAIPPAYTRLPRRGDARSHGGGRMTDNDPLAPVAAEIAEVRAAWQDVMNRAAEAVRTEHATNGGSETDLAKRAGVSRMTVRGWLGRPVTGRP